MFDLVSVAVVVHALIFGGVMFSFLTVLDLARYLGQTFTYNHLLREGRSPGALTKILPRVCLAELKQAVRTNMVIVGVSLFAIYYFNHFPSLVWFLVVLPVMFTIVFAFMNVLLTTQCRNADIKARNEFLTPKNSN